ncbi:hypothetical protein LOAG_08746 [Loa loa]|uniref:Uncharacterized protein n=1 Tax=Loa loa TaxID=7209 RepID=A0A1S0TT54_LOALO|nr:hypothetical protein LOAG_08746 [Loa loa]EFO19743.1 hypothetical protein LOAG_08746 [Loa loa]
MKAIKILSDMSATSHSAIEKWHSSLASTISPEVLPNIVKKIELVTSWRKQTVQWRYEIGRSGRLKVMEDARPAAVEEDENVREHVPSL